MKRYRGWPRGKKLSAAHRAAIKAGMNRPEARAAIGAFQRGRVKSAEECASISAGLKASWRRRKARLKALA